MDLAEFLEARLAEDEGVARDASLRRGPEWVVEEQAPPRWGDDAACPSVLAQGKPIADSDSDYGGRLVVEHIARWDPARVLAEVEAKRRIIDHVAAELAGSDSPWWYADALHPVLANLALPYADHPDYDPAWSPVTPSVDLTNPRP